MNKYTAWVSNKQGATEDIEYNDNKSRREIIAHVRRNYGRGWTLHIVDNGTETDCIKLR